ncbi:MAG: hypothetical protein ACK5UQ_21780 [Planctomycetota bacterium]
MNLGIYRSWHAATAAVVVLLLLAWHFAAPEPFGSRSDRNVLYLLTTGWVAFAAYVVLAAYAARRAAHRLRLSPEFAWKVPLPALEQAQSALRELDNRAARRELTDKAMLRREAASIVRRFGVHKVLRVDVVPATTGLGVLTLRTGPSEPLGRLASWLSAHVFYGFAAAIVVWLHGGGRCGSTMGLWLNVLSYFVIGSGLFGALMWTFGPTWLTRAERELSIEKAFALREHYREKLAQARSKPQREAEAAAAAVADAQGAADEAAADAPRDERSAAELDGARRKAAEKQAEFARLSRWIAESRSAAPAVPNAQATADALQEKLEAAEAAAKKALADSQRTTRTEAEKAAAKKAAQKKADDVVKAKKKADELQAGLAAAQERLQTDVAVLAGQFEAVAREAARLGRLRTLLRGWRLLHVPCSVLLLGLVVVHAISILYY